MNKPKVYGAFTKDSSHVCRNAAYIQWGTSEASIGSCLLLNPGSAEFRKINPTLELELNRTGQAEGELRTDPTMNQLITFVERIYDPSQLDGRFHIYNLFNIQNARSTNAVDEFKRLFESGHYDPTCALVPVEELRAHPWILLGWGCDEKSFPVELHAIKERWLKLISNSGIPYFGKQHPKGRGYYHPRYAAYHPELIDDFVQIYRRVVGDPPSLGHRSNHTTRVG